MDISRFSKRASFPTVIDSTMLSASSCPIKFFWEHCLNLHPVSKSIHLHAGGAFAYAIETVRKQFYIEKKPLEECLYEAFRQFTNFWGDYEAPENSYKDFYNTFAAVADYFHQYHPSNDLVQPFVKSDGTPAVEFTFSFPLPIMHPDTGEPLLYGGRCDMVGSHKGMNNATAIVDEKTAYSFGVDWAKSFSMRGQFLGYTYAAQYYDMPASMCIVRGIAIQQRSIKHLEAILQFPQYQIERWYAEMLGKVNRLIDYWNKRDFPMSYGSECSSFGGCPSMDLCTSRQPEIWFDTFAVRKWNPLDIKEAKA